MMLHHNCPEEKGSRCALNLWSPVDTPYQDIEDVAFSCFAKHQTECDDIVEAIVAGETSFTLDDNFSEEDLKYITSELEKHGLYVDFSLN